MTKVTCNLETCRYWLKGICQRDNIKVGIDGTLYLDCWDYRTIEQINKLDVKTTNNIIIF